MEGKASRAQKLINTYAISHSPFYERYYLNSCSIFYVQVNNQTIIIAYFNNNKILQQSNFLQDYNLITIKFKFSLNTIKCLISIQM